MAAIVSGPMFQPSEDQFRASSFKKAGAHYNIFGSKSEDTALDFLRQIFPDGKANEFNVVLFSTSGVHGSYTTLEQIEEGAKKYGWDGEPGGDDSWPDDFHGRDVTFLLIQPRIVSMTYGNAVVRNEADLAFLKALRESSRQEFAKIGGGSK